MFARSVTQQPPAFEPVAQPPVSVPKAMAFELNFNDDASPSKPSKPVSVKQLEPRFFKKKISLSPSQENERHGYFYFDLRTRIFVGASASP